MSGQMSLESIAKFECVTGAMTSEKSTSHDEASKALQGIRLISICGVQEDIVSQILEADADS